MPCVMTRGMLSEEESSDRKFDDRSTISTQHCDVLCGSNHDLSSHIVGPTRGETEEGQTLSSSVFFSSQIHVVFVVYSITQQTICSDQRILNLIQVSHQNTFEYLKAKLTVNLLELAFSKITVTLLNPLC